MTIWILTVVLLASLAALGHRQGAIRVAFSLVGIVIGASVAPPLGNVLKPLILGLGVKNPVLVWAIPPCVVFLIVLSIFKSVGLVVHKKVEVYYKYRAHNLQLSLWERLNSRLGLCLGLANGTAYLILVCLGAYMLSYWTQQMANSESDPFGVRLINRLGKDVHSTGMSKVAAAVDKTSPAYYDAADVAGLIYNNESVQQRLGRYPSLLGLAERPEFQDLANDAGFVAMRQKPTSIAEFVKYPKVETMLKNADLMKSIETALVPNLRDLNGFLRTGISTNFSEKILGRWDFDVNGAMGLMIKAKPNLQTNRKTELRRWMYSAFPKSTFVATPEKQAFLKNIPPAALGATTTEPITLTGQWKESGNKYELTFEVNGRTEQMTAEIMGERLSIPRESTPFAFIRQE